MEEEDALFWGIETTTDPASGGESIDSALDSTEVMPAEELCLRATKLAAPVTANSVPAIECSTAKIAPAGTVQDTKPAVQSQATNTEDAVEIQKPETGVQKLHQVTLGTQTESEDSLQEKGTLNLRETLYKDVTSNTLIETTSFGLTQPKNIRVRQKDQSRDPREGHVYRARLMDHITLCTSHLEIDSSSESRHLCRGCRPPCAGGSGFTYP